MRIKQHRIRQNHAYTFQEAADTVGVHKNTVRQWVKQGLKIMDAVRPLLIHGSELKAFLIKRKADARVVCRPHEFYCIKCQAARCTQDNFVDVVIRHARLMTLKGKCTVCSTTMNKGIGEEKILAGLNGLIIRTVQPEHLMETLSPTLNCYLKQGIKQ